MGKPTLKLLTYNAGLFRIKLFGRQLIEPAPYVEERFAQLAPALLASDADIIALQEVYDPAHQARLANNLRAAYPYQAAWTESRWRRLRSGLMLFSKYPITGAVGHRFHKLPWDEGLFVEKGMLVATVDAGALGRICLANCHHTSGGALWNPEGWYTDRARRHQYRQLFETIDRSEHGQRIALGDFNCGPEATDGNYQELLARGYADAWAACHGNRSEPTWDPANPLNAAGPHRKTSAQRLDHILLNNGLLRSVKVTGARIALNEPRVVTPGGGLVTLSDHYGLAVDLEAVNGPAAN